MPNIKSAIKRVKVTEKKNLRNRIVKSKVKTAVKKFDAAVAEGNKEAAQSTFKVAVKAIDKAAGKNLIHKNNAANKKSKMAGKLNALAD